MSSIFTGALPGRRSGSHLNSIMNAPTWLHHLHLLVSPDDGGPLILVEKDGDQALLSESAGLLYPILDDIPVLLAREDRSYELEFAAVDVFRRAEDGKIKEVAERTIELLEQRKGQKSFAWEDEVHWTKEYAKMAPNEVDDSKWNDRLWQRSPLVESAEVGNIESLVDIGCGEGQNFRNLLKTRIPADCLYIGADISLAGLRLNRKRNAWENAMFIVCSADRLPLKPLSVDLICYFGVLHHTENKAKNFSVHMDLLRPGGKIILHEAIERPCILGDRFRRHQSAHEERFDLRELEEEIGRFPDMLGVRCWKMRHSIFWSGCARLFGSRPFLNPVPFKIMTWIDNACIRILGPILPWFRGGEVLAVLFRPRESP